MAGPELDKVSTKNWDVGGHCQSLDHSGPVAAEVVIWPPGLVALKVLGHRFIGHLLSGHCPFVYQFLSFQKLFF